MPIQLNTNGEHEMPASMITLQIAHQFNKEGIAKIIGVSCSNRQKERLFREHADKANQLKLLPCLGKKQ
jgi:hypothetical protein